MTIGIPGALGPVLHSTMQDDPSSPALLMFLFQARSIVVSGVTGEIVYDKPNPNATSCVLVQETVVFSTDRSLIIDHLTLPVEPIEIELNSPVISRLGSTLVAAYIGVDKQLHVEQFDVTSAECPRQNIINTEATYGPPIAVGSDITDVGQAYVRILCSRGMICCMGDRLVQIAGIYSDVRMNYLACHTYGDLRLRRRALFRKQTGQYLFASWKRMACWKLQMKQE